MGNWLCVPPCLGLKGILSILQQLGKGEVVEDPGIVGSVSVTGEHMGEAATVVDNTLL